jgi:hypothetical protein
MNVQMRVYVLRTFVTHLLVHMHQKEKVALEIAAKNCKCKGPDAIRQRDAIFYFLKVNKTANESKF